MTIYKQGWNLFMQSIFSIWGLLFCNFLALFCRFWQTNLQTSRNIYLDPKVFQKRDVFFKQIITHLNCSPTKNVAESEKLPWFPSSAYSYKFCTLFTEKIFVLVGKNILYIYFYSGGLGLGWELNKYKWKRHDIRYAQWRVIWLE